ncbi:MAG TPA: cyclic nucleotide-binding domain-containing protein, partial [Caulobacteraceae bacterium]|nr:cyclic nucleotide-binding domain-containing protein [Caulobacteraceae bacterium]
MPPTVLETRRDQLFPILPQAAIDRIRHYGQVRAYTDGELLEQLGRRGDGLVVVLSGRVAVTRRDGVGHDQAVVEHGPGSFLGELAQLSGRPALVDGRAVGPVEALVISPQGLRAILVAEADLGETVMRALILRRVGLLEVGAGGPVIVGPHEHPAVR